MLGLGLGLGLGVRVRVRARVRVRGEPSVCKLVMTMGIEVSLWFTCTTW